MPGEAARILLDAGVVPVEHREPRFGELEQPVTQAFASLAAMDEECLVLRANPRWKCCSWARR